MRALSVIILIVVIVLLAAGVYYFLVVAPGSGSVVTPPGATTTMPGGTSSATPPAYTLDATTSASSTSLGTYLIAANDMTLYEYANDSSGTTKCVSATCVSLWPAYTVASGTALTESPAVAGAIGTITRPDGSVQVAYNGMPLYFYHADAAPGDTNGAHISSVWSIAHP